jgi:hypothetical protein
MTFTSPRPSLVIVHTDRSNGHPFTAAKGCQRKITKFTEAPINQRSIVEATVAAAAVAVSASRASLNINSKPAPGP